jgi:hypothetical protein
MDSSAAPQAWDPADEPQVISRTKQVFCGEAYYLCGFYFQRNGRRLHRAVWEAVNGPIPDGFHVHHVDEDRSNNQSSNLQLLEASEHFQEHRAARSQRSIDLWKSGKMAHVTAAAAEWHGTDAGSEWHRQHYLRTRDELHKRRGGIKACAVCGKEFEALRASNEFCGRNCKAKARRLSGVDDIQRDCVICGASFTINRYSTVKCCSRACGIKSGHNSRLSAASRNS